MLKEYAIYYLKKILNEKLEPSELSSTEEEVQTVEDKPSSEKENIICVQKKLKETGFGNLLGNSGPNRDGVDGVLGNKTINAIKKYQEKFNISNPGTGFVGPKTAKHMGCLRFPTRKEKKTSLTTKTPTITQTPLPTQPKEPATDKKVGCPSFLQSPYVRDKEQMIKTYQTIFPALDRNGMSKLFDSMISQFSENYKKTIPNLMQEVACQLAATDLRVEWNNSYVFIIDSIHHLIYLFSPKKTNEPRKYIDRDIMMDGKNKQRNDAKSVASAFLTFEDLEKKLRNKLKREPTDQEIAAEFDKMKVRYMPAGQYKGSEVMTKDETEYSGGKNNLLSLVNWDGKSVEMAIHGMYLGDDRKKMMEKALNVVNNPNDQQQIEEFIELTKKGKIDMDWSYGCINIPERFVKYISEYGKNAIILNIAEDTEFYLVQKDKTENYFAQMMNKSECQNPASLGAVKLYSA